MDRGQRTSWQSRFLGPYAVLQLSRDRYQMASLPFNDQFTKPKNPFGFDWLMFHESHTYRYYRSRLSPFSDPNKDNIYHPDLFSLAYLDRLRNGQLPFQLKLTIPADRPGLRRESSINDSGVLSKALSVTSICTKNLTAGICDTILEYFIIM